MQKTVDSVILVRTRMRVNGKTKSQENMTAFLIHRLGGAVIKSHLKLIEILPSFWLRSKSRKRFHHVNGRNRWDDDQIPMKKPVTVKQSTLFFVREGLKFASNHSRPFPDGRYNQCWAAVSFLNYRVTFVLLVFTICLKVKCSRVGISIGGKTHHTWDGDKVIHDPKNLIGGEPQ